MEQKKSNLKKQKCSFCGEDATKIKGIYCGINGTICSTCIKHAYLAMILMGHVTTEDITRTLDFFKNDSFVGGNLNFYQDIREHFSRTITESSDPSEDDIPNIIA